MPLPSPVHFLGWEKPVAETVAAFLCEEISAENTGAPAFDFSEKIVIVPTTEAGRKLREELVRAAGTQGKGIFTPEILTPTKLLHRLAGDNAGVASDTEAIFVLSEILRNTPPAEFAELFPVTPPVRGAEWAQNLADIIYKLRAALVESPANFDCAAVARFAENPEPARWSDLARLEEKYRAALAQCDLVDKNDRLRTGAQAPQLPENTKKIYFAATPAFSPLLAAALEKIPPHACAVAILAAAPHCLKNGFDTWGRPVSDFWIQREIDPEIFDENAVRLAASPEVFAKEVAKIIPPAAAGTEPSITLGLLDDTLGKAAERSLALAGARVYNPAGKPLRQHALGAWLAVWKNFLAGKSAETVGELLRFPFFAKFLAPNISLGTLLAQWDELCERRLPARLDDARRFSENLPELDYALNALRALAKKFDDKHWLPHFQKLLAGITAAPDFNDNETNAQATQKIAGIIVEELEIFKTIEKNFFARLTQFPPAEALALLLRRLSKESFTAERDPEAVPLAGRLELLWEDAPHLILAGMNEGCVPESITADAFLPGTFREKLGLMTNAERFARDNYLLQKILAQRAAGTGQTDIFVLQTNAAGDSQRPSRLLFLCAPEELPRRVKRLFAEPATPEPEPAWQAGRKFSPPVDVAKLQKIAEKINVTAFKDYLECPFRFYLKHVLGMEKTDDAKSEPDALEFGSMVHAALEIFGKDETARDSVDAGEIEKFLHAQIDLYSKNNYEDSRRQLPMPAVVAAESAKRRLSTFAREQTKLRNDGWMIWKTETKFAELLGKDFRLSDGGAIISGKIDRIDRHPQYGFRVIDYKTSEKAVKPADAHLNTVNAGTVWPPEFARFNTEKKIVSWKNLQLPLYRYLLRVALNAGFDEISAAYFNLPKALNDVGMYPWDGYTRELEESAVLCAAGVSENLRGRIFWPPNPQVKYDDFEELLSPSPEAVVAFEKFSAELQRAK